MSTKTYLGMIQWKLKYTILFKLKSLINFSILYPRKEFKASKLTEEVEWPKHYPADFSIIVVAKSER